MLFPDIKAYFIERETDTHLHQDEQYLEELEDSSNMDQFISVVADYYHLDIYEASHYILDQISI